MAPTQRPLPAGNPWKFSPDGSQLLYETMSPMGVVARLRIATSDLNAVTLNVPADVAGPTPGVLGAHYWDVNDPRFLHIVSESNPERAKVFVIDGLTTSPREIAAFANETGFGSKAAMSPNGKHAALWLGTLFRSSTLHLIDTETLTRSVMATASGRGFPYIGSFGLAPDGRRAANTVYEGGGFSTPGTAKVYLVALP